MKETTRLIINRIFAILSGVIGGAIVTGLGEMLSHRVHPMPEGIDTSDRAQLTEYISSLPTNAMVYILLAHAAGAIVAGIIASRMAKIQKRSAALFAGLILLLAAVLNLINIPHPMWFMVADVLLYVPMAISGYYIMNAIFPSKK